MIFLLYLDLNKTDSNNKKYIEINLYNKTDKKISYNINCSQANAFPPQNPTPQINHYKIKTIKIILSNNKISNLKNLNLYFYFADLIKIIKRIK